ncbi:Hypothetical predicted protein [Pelobates cultripes]|uniref:Ankyrin repeat domain-containing protein 26 n=1 Tax=Pelobates cultripes TaxID=61616 RepID=A0AAD1RTY1_PELCU|nr:Hypothetical predicted protein [Pelobates cultripes]
MSGEDEEDGSGEDEEGGMSCEDVAQVSSSEEGIEQVSSNEEDKYRKYVKCEDEMENGESDNDNGQKTEDFVLQGKAGSEKEQDKLDSACVASESIKHNEDNNKSVCFTDDIQGNLSHPFQDTKAISDCSDVPVSLIIGFYEIPDENTVDGVESDVTSLTSNLKSQGQSRDHREMNKQTLQNSKQKTSLMCRTTSETIELDSNSPDKPFSKTQNNKSVKNGQVESSLKGEDATSLQSAHSWGVSSKPDDPSDDESDDKECSEFEDHIEGAAVKADLPSSLTEEKLQGAADPVGRKVTLMSELGLEEDDVESPWDSEASLDSPRKQSSNKLAHTSNEELSKKSADVEINKQQTVSNILPAKDVSPKYPYVKASESNVKSDLMADLGLDDADDIEDVSDWDSTSHSPKYTTTTTHKTERLTEDLPLEAKPRTTAPEPMTVDLSSSLPPVPQEEEDDDDDDDDFDEKHVQSVLKENVLNSSKRDFEQMGKNNDSLKKAVLTQVNHSAVVYQKENEKPQSVQMKPEGDDVCDSGKDVLKTPVTSDLQDKTKQMARQSQFKGKDGSKRTRKPLGIKIPDKQQKATTNGHLLDVYDDSTFSETSQEDNGRDDKFSNEKDKIDDGDEFDELSQSSDTTTDVTESPTFKNAMLLVEQLNVDGQDSLNLLKIQDIIRKYERSLQKENGRYSLLLRKVKKMESNHKDLQQITEKNRELKSVLDHQKLEWESDLNHLRFMLKQEEEKRKSADILYEKSREQLRKKEDQCCKEMEDKQQLEMTVRNMERELRSLSNNVKQAEEERNEAQRLLSQERNARVLQEDFLNNLRRKNEEEEAAKIILSKSVEVHSQPSETTERVKDLSQRNHALEEEITLLKQELEKVQCQNEEEKRQYLDENEVLKEKVDDLKKDLKINEEALTQNLIQYNGQLNALKTEATIFCTKLEHEKQAKERLETELESFRSRLNSTQQEQEKSQMLKTEVERTFQRERDEWMRSKDKLDHELSSIRENNKNLSQQLSRAEAKSNELECDLHRRGLSFQEKVVLLESTQRDLTQAQCRIKELESTLQTEKDQINKNTIILESRQERLAQIQSENMQLRQQLEDMQSKGIFKDKLVTDAQDKFTDIFSKLRADTERQVHLVEERNKDLINKSNELREQVYRLETEKVEGESARRQLQQELADAFKKLSMSEASLEVITRYRNDLEEEKQNLQKEVEKCRNKLQDLEDQFIQSERLNHQLKNLLDDKEREIVVAIQKAQEFSTATAAAEKSAKQLEEHVQKLEIENAKIEATAKHQTTQIEILQRELQESISNRNRMEDLLTGLQSSKMGLEEKLNQQVSKQTALSMNAHESHSMWEEELKSRSRLGIRLAELDREKADLVEQVDRERKKVKKLAEMKKSVESRFDQEVKRNSELHRDLTGMKKLLKTTKKKLKEFESLGHQQSRPEDGSAHKNIESDSERSRLKDKVEQLSVSLERESMRYKQLESASRDLQEQLYSMKHLHRKHERQEKGQRHLEGEVADLKRHLESSKMDQSTMENFKREIEERGRQELQQKLEEVNLFLQTQAAAQDSLEQIRSANDASLRSQLESRIQDLESELHRIKTQQKERECQKESSLTELDRFKDLYAEEMKLRKVLASKLERTSEKLEEANTKLLTERQRSKSLIASSIVNGSLATSPILDSSQLGLHARNLAMNGGFGLGGSFLSSTGNGLTVNRIDSYLAQMHHDLEKSIAKELQQGNSELETGYTRVPPVGSTAATLRNPDTDLDPVSRTAQQYLEVLKKNYMI